MITTCRSLFRKKCSEGRLTMPANVFAVLSRKELHSSANDVFRITLVSGSVEVPSKPL